MRAEAHSEGSAAVRDTNSLGLRILAGEEEAFIAFQYAYRRLFLAYFLRRGLPDVDARDLTVDCLTDIPLKAATHWRPEGGSFDAWVRTVVRNTATDRLRKQVNSVELDERLFVPRAEGPMQTDGARFADLYQHLSELSPDDRLVLELRYLRSNEPTYADIAAELSRASVDGKTVTAGTARVRLFRAIRRLRQQYGAAADESEEQ